MARPTGFWGITACYFSVHLQNGSRVVRVRRILLYGFVPVVVGTVLTARLGVPAAKLELIVAVLSVLAAVLIGLLPLAHSILGQTDHRRKYVEGESAIAQHEIDRVQTLQDLHAAISWAVILLVAGLAACAGLALVPKGPDLPDGLRVTRPEFWWYWLPRVFALLLYMVMASTALTFFDVARGVFEAMENHAETIKRQIRSNVAPKKPDEIQE